MKTHHRPFVYESPDFKLMCALVVRDNASKRESFVWHVARLVDWKYNLFGLKRLSQATMPAQRTCGSTTPMS